MAAKDSSNDNVGMRVKEEQRMLRIENPFALKVGQVFTGFGIGCGIGIGVGRPLNLGAIPVVNQVMTATRGATDAFSGVSRQFNTTLRKLGAKNIEAGIGCGVGFGHGFGVGLAVKPGLMHQIQSRIVLAMMQIMMKLGLAPNLSSGQGALSAVMQNRINTRNGPINKNPVGNIMQLATEFPDQTPKTILGEKNSNIGSSLESFTLKSSGPSALSGSQTEKVISNFLQNPLLKYEDGELNEQVGQMESKNNMLQMVLKHQQIIEELMAENEKLRQILIEDLKIPPSKLQGRYSSRNESPCLECFECRRKQRRR